MATWTFRFLRTASPHSSRRWSKSVRKVYPISTRKSFRCMHTILRIYQGITTRQISDTLSICFEASECFISDVTDKINPQIQDWQNRPLSEVYPVLYIDAPITQFVIMEGSTSLRPM